MEDSQRRRVEGEVEVTIGEVKDGGSYRLIQKVWLGRRLLLIF